MSSRQVTRQFISQSPPQDASADQGKSELCLSPTHLALIENSSDGVVLVDRQGNYMYTSSSSCRITGYSESELVGRKGVDFVHPADHAILSKLMAMIIQEPVAAATVRYRHRRRNGDWVWLEGTARNLLSDPNVNAIIINQREITEHKHVEEKLRESEERFAKAFHLNPIAMSISTMEGRFIDANESFLRMFGYRRDQVIGHSSLELNMWADPNQRAEIGEFLLRNKSAHDLEGSLRTLSGEIRHSLGHAELIEMGGEVCVLVLLHDITEQKLVKATLQKSEERYRELFDNANDLIYVHDLDGRFISVNRAAERLAGYRREEIFEMNITNVVAPEYYELARKMLQRKFAEGGMTTYELEIITKDRRRLPIEVSTRLVFKEGKPVAVQGIGRDMTERKRVAQALRESEERFRLLSEAAFEGIGICERGKVVDVSTSLAEMLGYQPKEMIGKDVADFVAPEFRSLLASHIGDEPFEHNVLRKDGSIFPVESRGRTMSFEGKIVRVAAIRDITERKQAEEELQRRANQFSALYESMRDLAIQWNLPVLLQRIIDHAATLLKASGGGTIYLYDQLSNHLKVAVHSGSAAPDGMRAIQEERIAGRVGMLRQPMIVNDYQSWENRDPKAEEAVLGAVVQVPMLYGGELIGVLSVSEMGDAKRKYADADVRLLSLFAGQASSAVHNAQLFEETNHRLSELEAINKISAAMRGALTLDEMLPVLVDEALQVVGTDTGVIWLDRTNRDELQVAIARGWFGQVVEGPSSSGQGFAGHVFTSGQPYVTREFVSDPNVTSPTIGLIPAGWGGACVPIRAGKRVIGVLLVSVRLPRQINPDEVNLLTTLAEIGGSAIHRARLHESLEASYDTTLEGWSRALDLRDKETEGHTQRVAAITLRLAQAIGVAPEKLVHIRRGALLHDIGKMAIPDGILFKPGPLNDEERAIVREHPMHAFEMLSPIEYLKNALDIPLYHHEKWDGTGYPRGLAREEIPIAARIFAVVDVWDALLSTRAYREGWEEPRVRAYIREQSGIHFDPRVVEEFMRLRF